MFLSENKISCFTSCNVLPLQVFDAQRMLYVLATLKSILNTNPRPFVCAMSSTSISSTNTPQLIKLQQVLARHKRCITGNRAFSHDLSQECGGKIWMSCNATSHYVMFSMVQSLYSRCVVRFNP